MGASIFGSNDSWAAIPPGRYMLMIDFATPSLTAPLAVVAPAWSRNMSLRLSPSVPTRPTKRNSRREGRQEWSGLLHQELESRIINAFFTQNSDYTAQYRSL